MRRAALIVVLAFLVPPIQGVDAAGLADPFPGAAASYLLKVDGRPVFAHAPARRLPMASLTKIMTALLVLETCRLGDVVTVGRAAAAESGARLGLRAGDRMSVGELLAAALLRSANDACRALAEHAGGDERRFVAMMNRRAAALGLRNTRFGNACGHDQEGHFTTAADLARLSETALANATFAQMVSLVSGEVGTADGRRTFVLENSNAIVGRYAGAKGVKTGSTDNAGKCLVALAERNGTRVLLVLLDAPDRWWTAVGMMDRAFAEAPATGRR